MKNKFLLVNGKHSNNWSGRQDLNLRPLTPQANALPDCATSRKLKIRIVTGESQTARLSTLLTGTFVQDLAKFEQMYS